MPPYAGDLKRDLALRTVPKYIEQGSVRTEVQWPSRLRCASQEAAAAARLRARCAAHPGDPHLGPEAFLCRCEVYTELVQHRREAGSNVLSYRRGRGAPPAGPPPPPPPGRGGGG